MTGKDSQAGTPAHSTQLSRQQILQATCVCLRQEGYDATTIRRIASALSCAIGSIYRYFQDKHELLSAVTQQTFESLAQRVEGGAAFEHTAAEYAQLAAQDAESYRLMFWLSSRTGQPAAKGQALPEVVERMIAAWAVQMGDAGRARRFWAVLHGAIIAGDRPLETLAALGLSAAPAPSPAAHTDAPRPSRVAYVDPHDNAALQIVTVMHTPPAPRAARATDASSQVSAAAGAGVATMQRAEDVCLL